MRPVVSTVLRDHIFAGKPYLYDPFRGTDLREDEPQYWKAVELGLEPYRYCPLCGRRMETQVMPTEWTAICSRHGKISSYYFEH